MVALVVVFLFLTANLWGEWLWFGALNYESVLLTTLLSHWGITLAVVVIFWLVFSINFFLTYPSVQRNWQVSATENDIPLRKYVWQRLVSPLRLRLFFILAALVLAVLFAPSLGERWLMVQSFLNSTEFGLADPIFQKDIGFFVFSLPFYQMIYSMLLTLLLASLALAGGTYFLLAPGELFQRPWGRTFAWKHIGVLSALLLAVLAFGFQLDGYSLLYSARGTTFGAGYTDVHASLPGYRILTVVSLGAALAVLFGTFLRRPLWSAAAALLVVLSVGLLGFYPSLVQRFNVEPNEFAREKPYLENNIKYTRLAYDLADIEEVTFPADPDVTVEDLEVSTATLSNIRLWDYRPLQQVYNQLQTLRPQYRFLDVDIDRYLVDGQKRQVMLAARELDQSGLDDQAQVWVNQRLRYTHGYGAAVSPVGETTPEGLPVFWLRDFPPAGKEEFTLKRPQIYYGEVDAPYVLVNTNTPEFDYPTGAANAESFYEGSGGVAVGSPLERALFAIKMADYRLLISGEITPESRILFRRQIEDRVTSIAPFLDYDSDPYLVLADNQFYWIIDAYTTTAYYPYAEPAPGGNFNYVRNSVKVVVDAYNGTVDFYLWDPEDPLAATYQKIFPGLFKSAAAMPESLKPQVRNPVDIFSVQATMLRNYHMTNAETFFNREDAWEIPTEKYINETVPVEPYYVMLQFPGETTAEFALIQPYKPLRELQNMIAWLVVRNDEPHYGEKLLYLFPKERHVYGPMQVEARIDQDSAISQQLTLWDQRGSQVIRGNLLVIPVGDSLLYVEPIFLQAEGSRLPELTRIIVSSGEQVVMEEDFATALNSLFGYPSPENLPANPPAGGEPPEDTGPLVEPAPGDDWQALVNDADRLYNQAQESLQAGNWAAYGESLEELGEILARLKAISEE